MREFSLSGFGGGLGLALRVSWAFSAAFSRSSAKQRTSSSANLEAG
jgi:hypothetical protein